MSTITESDVIALGEQGRGSNVQSAYGDIIKVPVTTTGSSLISMTAAMVTRTVNQPINLSGENYFLFTSPSIGSMVNAGSVGDVFAVMNLSSAPGSTIFSDFSGGITRFDDGLLAILDKLVVQFTDQEGNLFDFLGLPHQYTLRITERVQEPGGDQVNISSSLGRRDG
jgi:hypothetical protein